MALQHAVCSKRKRDWVYYSHSYIKVISISAANSGYPKGHLPRGADPSVLDANYPPQLTVGRRRLGGGGGGAPGGSVGGGRGPSGAIWGGGGGGSKWGNWGVGGGGSGSPYLPLPSL